MPIHPEITRAFAKVARENFKLKAELRALWGILELHRVQSQPPLQWKELVRQARETPEYRDVEQQFSQQLQKLESLADENEVREILRAFPKSDWIN